MERRSGSIITGLVLILLGVIVLGHMNNWWSFDWHFLATLWPLILIIIGLRLLLPRGLPYDLVTLALLIAVIGTQAFVPPKPVPERHLFGGIFHEPETSGQTNITGPKLSGAQNLRFSTTTAAGTFTLKALNDDSDRLYTVHTSRGNFQAEDRRDNDTAISEVRPEKDFFIFHRLNYDLTLNPNIPIELNLDAGASKADIDLSGLELTTFDFDAGATSSTIRLGTKSAHQHLTMDIGASSLTLRAPKSAGLKITYDSGLSSNNFQNAGLNQSNNTYTTPDYDQAATQIEIELDGGASSINLERF